MTPIYYRFAGLSYGWFSNESGESPHVHVFKGNDRSASAKFWLRKDGAALEHNKVKLSHSELRQAKRVIDLNRELFVTSWYDFFS